MSAPPVRVRFAPSPTGFLHIGGVRTALFNWLFARHEGGEFLLRIENTDTSREVAESVAQIVASLSWLGLDWDGEPTFQLDRLERHQEVARQLLAAGHAYEDEGAIRFRAPDEGRTSWVDAVKGEVSVENRTVEDVVILRGDGRPTYNFAAPVDDADMGITHVIRGEDHVSNTPKQLLVLQAMGAAPPVYAHVPNVLGTDGRKLSKRHGAISLEEFRSQGYVPDALVNYLALLGWSLDDKTTVLSRDELVTHFTLGRIGSSPATFDYEKLTWLNGHYLRQLTPAEYADVLVRYLDETGFAAGEADVRAAAPLVQEKIATLGEFPSFAGFLFRRVAPEPGTLDGGRAVIEAAALALAATEPFTAAAIEQDLRALCERLGLKPRQAFQPLRLAITGSKVSPGLFESIELLGRRETLERLADAARDAS